MSAALVGTGDLRAELPCRRAGISPRLSALRPHALVWREGVRLPAKLRTMLYRRLVAQPYEAVTYWLRQRTAQVGVDDVDHEALALVMVESMSAYRGMRSIFGRVPGDVNDERLVEMWVDVALAYAREHGIAPNTVA